MPNTATTNTSTARILKPRDAANAAQQLRHAAQQELARSVPAHIAADIAAILSVNSAGYPLWDNQQAAVVADHHIHRTGIDTFAVIVDRLKSGRILTAHTTSTGGAPWHPSDTTVTMTVTYTGWRHHARRLARRTISHPITSLSTLEPHLR